MLCRTPLILNATQSHPFTVFDKFGTKCKSMRQFLVRLILLCQSIMLDSSDSWCLPQITFAQNKYLLIFVYSEVANKQISYFITLKLSRECNYSDAQLVYSWVKDGCRVFSPNSFFTKGLKACSVKHSRVHQYSSVNS